VETERGKVCALTIAPSRGAEVFGVFVPTPRTELAGLDLREQGYQRVPLAASDFLAHDMPGFSESTFVIDDGVFTYISIPEAHRPGSWEFPIWRSYLECVMAGFLELGGAAAVQEFIVSTDGWGAPILDDRAAPKYMRAVTLPAEIRSQMDALIRAANLDSFQFSAAHDEMIAPGKPPPGEFG